MGTEKEKTLEAELGRIYNEPGNPGSFGGVDRLYLRAKEEKVEGVSRQKVQAFLRGVPTYSLHRQARRRFTRNPTFVHHIDQQWQADLVDMQPLARANNGMHYILTCIDVFSKFAWAVPLRRKSAEEMVKALKELFQQSAPRRPLRLQTDKGREFFNAEVEKLLKSNGIQHFASWSDQKAAVVERFNRTLKERMWRYFSARQTNHYLDILLRLVQAYNQNRHRSIGMAPEAVRKSDEGRIFKRLYGGKKKHLGAVPPGLESVLMGPAEPPPPTSIIDFGGRLKPGAMVRISRVKGEFEKGYVGNWSEEDFRVREMIEGKGARMVYKLEDKLGEPIHGSWYKEELQPITRNRYLIERILKRRKAVDGSGETECLIEWRGWPKKFNSWILERDIPQ